MAVVISILIRAISVSIQAALSILVFLPIVSYLLYQFIKMSSSVMIQKRYPQILKYQSIFIVIWFAFSYPLIAADFGFIDTLQDDTRTMISRINSSVFPFMTGGVFITTAWRFWHIYFELKYSSSQKNSEWKYHLDPSLVEHNFWLTHKKDYGSTVYTRKIVFWYYVIGVATQILFYQCVINTNYMFFAHLWCAVFHGIVSVFPLVLYWKVPQYSDHFFIKYEFKVISIATVIVMGTAFCCVFIGFFLWSMGILMIIIPISGTILFSSMTIISFYQIPKKIRGEQLKIRLSKLAHGSHEELSIASQSHTIATTRAISQDKKKLDTNRFLGKIVHRLSTNAGGVRLSLSTILAKEKTFKIFMQHLAKEFSMECLLCFVETIQYKFEMKKRFDIIDPNAVPSEMNVTVQRPMAEIVPISRINREGFPDMTQYQPNDDPILLINQAKLVCLNIYHKYIQIGSELEVNISYEDRCRLSNLMNDQSFFIKFNIVPNELFCLFDNVSTAMYRLMEGSYVRFRTTEAFKVCQEK